MQVYYRWQSDDPKTHSFKITLSLSGALPAHIWSIWLPVWTPGSYLVREFSRHINTVQALLTDTDSGQNINLDVNKTAKNRWSIETQHALKNGTLSIEYLVYAFDASVRAAYFDTESLTLDGAAVWLSIEGTEHLPRHLEWIPPSEMWSMATALEPKTTDEKGFGLYHANNYLEQIDSPVMAGRHLQTFTLLSDNTPHTMVFDDAYGYDMPLDLKRLQNDMAILLQWHHDFWPGKLPFSHYATLTHILDNNYGGLEHAYSTRLACSRHDLPRQGLIIDHDSYTTYLSLFSHEYFHSWWVKRLRPDTLIPYGLKHEQYTSLLWIFEGFTAYFDDLSLVQTGLISRKHYLTLLEKLFDRVLHTPAHHCHTLHEASFDAWIRAYRPDENTPNSTVNYYDQGAVLALVFDLILIQHQSSLKQLLATLWKTHIIDTKTDICGLNEDHLLNALLQQAPDVDWKTLLHQSVHTPTLPDYAHALHIAGINIEWVKPSTEQSLAQRLGVRFKKNSMVISHVLNGRAAAQAGVHVGDEWIALNGERLKSSSWLDTFNRFDHTVHNYELHFFREGRLRTLTLSRPATLTFHQLRINANADLAQKEAAKRWLNPGGLSES